MVSPRAGAGAALPVRALRSFLRGLLLVVGCVLAGDLLAVILVLPSALLGAAAGLPITAGLLVLGGFAVRKIVEARRGPDERQRRLRRRAHVLLRRLERAQPPDRVGYREAAGELGFFGYAAGLFVGHSAFVVAINAWPDQVKALPFALLYGAVLGVSAVGFGGVVLYRVHLHDRAWEWRCRYLWGRLSRITAELDLPWEIEPVD